MHILWHGQPGSGQVIAVAELHVLFCEQIVVLRFWAWCPSFSQARVVEGTFDDALRRTAPVVLPVQEDLKRREAEAEDTRGEFSGPMKGRLEICVEGQWRNLPPEKNRWLRECHIRVHAEF